MPELQRLRADHAAAVLAFELANRAYFTASISDRGDEFYDQFPDRHRAMLAEQEAGEAAFYVLVADDGSVLGRFNLYDIKDGTAVLGYRVAQDVAGRGVATATVRELCGLVAAQYGLRTLKAATSHDNAASQKVLVRAGFIPVGPAGPADLGGKQGTWYQRDLDQPLRRSSRANENATRDAKFLELGTMVSEGLCSAGGQSSGQLSEAS
ncbi:MAG TPA: GNAT family N-acetyltransferase [Streptosporangiaceae bacterium]